MDPEQRELGEAAIKAVDDLERHDNRQRRKDRLLAGTCILLTALAVWRIPQEDDFGVYIWTAIVFLNGVTIGAVWRFGAQMTKSLAELKVEREQIQRELDADHP